VLEEIKSQRTLASAIYDLIKNITNVCIRIVTLGKSPYFFNTTTKPVDMTIHGINSICSALNLLVAPTPQNEKEDLTPSMVV
jgi:hypothetical protein